MTRRAVPAKYKGRGHKGPPVEKRQWKDLERNNGRKERGARRKLCLKNEKTSGRIFKKTAELEIENQIVGSLTGLWEMNG
jgi:hypothetical protein